MAVCAFLGLGVMGGPMAGWLVKAGHDVRVWNRSPEKMELWKAAYGGAAAAAAASPGEAVGDAEFVFMCLGGDPDVEAVFSAFEGALSAGATVVDHTTASSGLALRLSDRANNRGAVFLDAPVSGGQAGAEKGQLTVMAGGEESAFNHASPIMKAYARQMTLIGGVGSGQLAKSVNQICIAGIVQGLAEGLHFAEAAGLDQARVIEAIAGGAAQSWQMDNRWRTMSEGAYEFGFAVDWMRKDLSIALDKARESGARLPLTALVDQFYADIQAQGGGRWDTSSLLSRLTPGEAK